MYTIRLDVSKDYTDENTVLGELSKSDKIHTNQLDYVRISCVYI